MKLIDLLTEEETKEPKVRYFGSIPDGYSGTPEDHKMIRKMKTIYKALIKGRGEVQLFRGTNYPPLDVSYELPPLNDVVILIDYPTKRALKNGEEIEYIFDVVGKVKYKFHNLETQMETNIDRLMMHRSYDISFVYKRKFEDFGVRISA
jgi:hypothetical protein